MNHIDEAFCILDFLNASEITKQAFCLHPLFKSDSDFIENLNIDLSTLIPNAIVLTIEYRSVANEYLSHRNILSLNEIRLSPLEEIKTLIT